MKRLETYSVHCQHVELSPYDLLAPVVRQAIHLYVCGFHFSTGQLGQINNF